MTYSIVIPVYNNWQLTHQLLLDLYKVIPPDVEIVVADDCSTQWETRSGLEWWGSRMLEGRLKVVRPEKNVGFLLNANNGVKNSEGEIVILLNNDVRVNENFIPKVEEVLKTDEVPVLAGGTLWNRETGWNRFGDVIFPYLGGWFLAFRRTDWDRFGGFDARFIPYDFEDVDISTTYLKSGGRLVALDVNIQHISGQSIHNSPERQLQTKINQKKFQDKWCKGE